MPRLPFAEPKYHSRASYGWPWAVTRTELLTEGHFLTTLTLALSIAVLGSGAISSGLIQQPQCNTIIGRVTMVDARVLPDATVTAKNKKTKKVDEAHSDNKGEYSLCLLPGEYEFAVTRAGFLSQKRKSLHIDLVHGRAVDFVLKFRSR